MLWMPHSEARGGLGFSMRIKVAAGAVEHLKDTCRVHDCMAPAYEVFLKHV